MFADRFAGRMHRRTVLTSIPAALATTAGCLGVLTGSEPLERSATPARVSDAALQETEYELAGAESQRLERSVTVAGQTREVHAVNEFARYTRTVSLPPLGEQELGVFAVVATPAFEIAGETMSPVEEWSNRKIATQLQEQYSNVEIGDEVDTASVDTLGTTMELSKFEGTATVAGEEGVDIYVHVGKVQHDEDFVIAIGVYPQKLSDEVGRIRTLVRGLEHE